MSVVNPHIRFVYEDYKSLPESMAKRYELLNGEILMVPAPRIVPKLSHTSRCLAIVKLEEAS